MARFVLFSFLSILLVSCGGLKKQSPDKIPEEKKPLTVATGSSPIVGKIINLHDAKFQIMDEEEGSYLKQFRAGTRLVNIELFSEQINEIPKLKEKGAFVVCYYSLSYEAWRPDAKNYPAKAKGKKMSGWNELWPDLNNKDLHTFMDRRDDLAKVLGCDGVENDNMDNSSFSVSNTGFRVTKEEAVKSAERRADYAHKLGLKWFAKNTPEISKEVSIFADGIFIEECNKYKECSNYADYVNHQKFVGMVEYSSSKCKGFKGAQVQYHNKGYFDADYTECK